MRLEDALFNWLQIQLVALARPKDRSARDTVQFFAQILTEDHGLSAFEVEKTDETMVHLKYEKDGRIESKLYRRELAEQLLADIESNPKYN